MALFAVLRRLGGAARREQLLARGVRRAEFETALRVGSIVRPHRGVYSLPETPRDVVLARIFRASLACLSACEAYGLPVINRPAKTHLVTECPRSMARPGIRPMTEVIIHLSEQVERGSLRVAPWVAIDQAGECATPLAQLALVDAALARGLMTLEDLGRFTRTSMSVREWLRAQADSRAESLLETIARVRLKRAGYEVECQVRFSGVGRVDLLIDKRVIVELDGRLYHEDAHAFTRDRQRDRALQILGFRVARFTYDEVMSDRPIMESAVRALLGSPLRMAA